MAIKYLAGNRIQGSSVAPRTTSYNSDTDFDNDTNWTDNNGKFTIDATNNVMLCDGSSNSTNNYAVYDLQTSLGSGNNAHASNWVLRYTFNLTAWTAPSSGGSIQMLTGISDKDHTAQSNTANDHIGTILKQHSSSSANRYFASTYSEDGVTGDPFRQSNEQNRYTSVTTTTYYVEIIRTGTTTYTATLRTGSHTGTSVSSNNVTMSSSTNPANLRYIYIQGKNSGESDIGGAITGTLYDLEFYNGITDASTVDERPTPSGSIEITTDSHRVASSTHGTFSSGGTGQGNWYCYSSDSNGYRAAQQYAASQFSSIPSGATVTGVKYSGGSQRYYGAQSNPKLVGMSTAPNSHTSVSSFISDVQGSSTVYVADSGFADSTYSGNGGTPVPFTDTFNSTGVAYVVNAIANGDDVFFGFQSTDVSGNTGYYGFNLTGTSQAKLIIEYTMPSEPQLVDGTIFEYTDTGKHYIWNSSTSTWAEIA